MKTRSYALCLTLVAMAVAARAYAADAPSAERPTKPNIVFVLVDDMAWTGLSVPMDPGIDERADAGLETPNIGKLATAGLRFSRAYSPAPLCTPTRAAILTGKTPAELHITTPGRDGDPESWHRLVAPNTSRSLPVTEATFATALRKAGYTTALIGKWHLGRIGPGDHGFDRHDGTNIDEGETEADNPKDIFGVTKRGIEFMKEAAGEQKPFYLQVSHYAVHSPEAARPETMEKFGAESSDRRVNKPLYRAMTWDLDVSVGMLAKAIDDLGIAKKTYLFFMSDNGGASTPRFSWSAPLRGGKGSLYEGGIRVPFFVRGPDVKAGAFCATPIMGCDLYPTFCDLAGVGSDVPEGASLVPLFGTGKGKLERKASGFLFHYPHYGKRPGAVPHSAIILGDWKLVLDLDSKKAELFDLSADPFEKTDLSSKEKDRAKKLLSLLMKRLEETGAQMPTENPSYDEEASPPARGGRRRSGR